MLQRSNARRFFFLLYATLSADASKPSTTPVRTASEKTGDVRPTPTAHIKNMGVLVRGQQRKTPAGKRRMPAIHHAKHQTSPPSLGRRVCCNNFRIIHLPFAS